jgi:Phosphodiester glycosidase
VVVLDPAQPLAQWCAANRVDHALIGGFYVRADGTPLGDLRTDGRPRSSAPFDSPWNRIRACVHSDGGAVSLRSRIELPDEPGGDLLQAGPMLVRDGVCLTDPGVDTEGFSAGARQFDSDITVGRHPRAALGTSATDLIAVVCDGRTETEAGLGLTELAQAMVDLGADDAINLDGGGSASLVVSGELVNVPHEEHGMRIPGGRSVPTAIRFAPR